MNDKVKSLKLMHAYSVSQTDASTRILTINLSAPFSYHFAKQAKVYIGNQSKPGQKPLPQLLIELLAGSGNPSIRHSPVLPGEHKGPEDKGWLYTATQTTEAGELSASIAPHTKPQARAPLQNLQIANLPAQSKVVKAADCYSGALLSGLEKAVESRRSKETRTTFSQMGQLGVSSVGAFTKSGKYCTNLVFDITPLGLPIQHNKYAGDRSTAAGVIRFNFHLQRDNTLPCHQSKPDLFKSLMKTLRAGFTWVAQQPDIMQAALGTLINRHSKGLSKKWGKTHKFHPKGLNKYGNWIKQRALVGHFQYLESEQERPYSGGKFHNVVFTTRPAAQQCNHGQLANQQTLQPCKGA